MKAKSEEVLMDMVDESMRALEAKEELVDEVSISTTPGKKKTKKKTAKIVGTVRSTLGDQNPDDIELNPDELHQRGEEDERVGTLRLGETTRDISGTIVQSPHHSQPTNHLSQPPPPSSFPPPSSSTSSLSSSSTTTSSP